MIYQDLNKLCKEPLVSVFISTYNQENTVGKTIESVLAQNVSFPYEIVIAEDCSKDNTLNVCRSYFEQHPDIIRVHHNETNKGIIGNYHETRLECARGKYLAGVAGDDWWHDKNKLQKEVEFLESHPDYGLVFSQTYIYSQATGKMQKYKPNYASYSFDQLIIQNCISALTTCYRKDLFFRYVEEVNPVTVNFPGEDYPLWIWLSHETKLHRIDEPLTTYRLQVESLSHSRSKTEKLRFETDRINIKMFFYNFFKLQKPDILHDIYLQYYCITFLIASEAENHDVENDRDKFFRDNGYTFLSFMSKMGKICANKPVLSPMMEFAMKVFFKLRVLNRYYKVYNKSNDKHN